MRYTQEQAQSMYDALFEIYHSHDTELIRDIAWLEITKLTIADQQKLYKVVRDQNIKRTISDLEILRCELIARLEAKRKAKGADGIP